MAIDSAVEVAVEEVADNLEELAEATRSINTTAVGYFFVGVAVGVGIGFFYGYKFNREKIRAEAFKQSDEELEKLREYYQQKTVILQEKPSVESIVEEKGYDVPEVTERPLPAPVPGLVDPRPVSAPPVVHYSGVTGTGITDVWSYPAELALRNSEAPYIIHRDEFRDSDTDYSQVTYTFYSLDGVLTGEDDRPLPHPDLVVGPDNLRFGHGSDDPDIVHVRNDKLELEMEICRSPMSYERDVLGLNTDESS